MDNISNFLNPFRSDISETQRKANEKIEEVNEKKTQTQEALEGIGAPFLEEGITRTTGILGKVAKNYAKDRYGIDVEKYEKLADSYIKGGKAGLQKELYRTVAEKGHDIGEKFTGLDKEAQERVANAYANQKLDGDDLKTLVQNAKLRKDLVENEQAKAQIERPEPIDLPQPPEDQAPPFRPPPPPEEDEAPPFRPDEPPVQTEGDKVRNMTDAEFERTKGTDDSEIRGLKNRFNQLNDDQKAQFKDQFRPQVDQQITKNNVADGHDLIDSLQRDAGRQDFIGQAIGDDEDRRIGQQAPEPEPQPRPQADPEDDIVPPERPQARPNLLGQAEENVGDNMGVPRVVEPVEQVGEKVASFGEDTEKALAVATEGSEALDESPVGLLLTAGLGLATVFTGIFGVHKQHEVNNPQPINPTVQIGV